MVSDYPQHDKLASVKDDHSLICSFVEWLQSHESAGVAEWIDDQYWPISGQAKIETLIAEFFEIDREEFLREKERMFSELRAAADRVLAKERANDA